LQLQRAADPNGMEHAALNFVIWWYAALGLLGAAAWHTTRANSRIDWEAMIRVFLVGIATGLLLYLVPSGIASVGSNRQLELRFFCALAITWLVAMRALAMPQRAIEYPALALAGFVGVNVPLLAFVASATMVCGLDPSCA
jgi:hypothetical protein